MCYTERVYNAQNFFFLHQYVQPCLSKNPKYTFYTIKSSLTLAYYLPDKIICLSFLKVFYFIRLSNLMTMSVSYEGSSRTASCALNCRSTFYYYHLVHNSAGPRLINPRRFCFCICFFCGFFMGWGEGGGGGACAVFFDLI